VGDLVGVSRQVVDGCCRTEQGSSVVCPATSTAASGVGDVLLLAQERDRRQQGRSAICYAALREPADGPGYRLVDALQGTSPSVSLCVFTEREGEGS
jgi:hypothetical protein